MKKNMISIVAALLTLTMIIGGMALAEQATPADVETAVTAEIAVETAEDAATTDATLQDLMLADYKTKLDVAVAAGKLTQEQADTLYAGIETRVSMMKVGKSEVKNDGLTTVLTACVADGTITQEQADAIMTAYIAQRDAMIAANEAMRGANSGMGMGRGGKNDAQGGFNGGMGRGGIGSQNNAQGGLNGSKGGRGNRNAPTAIVP